MSIETGTSQEEASFVMLDPDREELKNSILSRIGQINDLRLKEISEEEIIKLYPFFRRNNPLPEELLPLYLKYIGGSIDQYTAVEGITKKEMFCQYVERLGLNKIGTDSKETSASYGLFAPSYIEGLLPYQKEVGENYPCQSLLVGARTINSVQEFLAVNHAIFPRSENTVIDINTDCLYGSPDCEERSALKTSYKDNRFDTIQTNYLLVNLISSKNRVQGNPIDRRTFPYFFLKEAFRILKNNGRLIMVEGDFRSGTERHLFTQEYLLEVGFKKENLQLINAGEFLDLTDVARLTRCSHGNQPLLREGQSTESKKDALLIIAKK